MEQVRSGAGGPGRLAPALKRNALWRRLNALEVLVQDRNRTLGHGSNLGGDVEYARNMDGVLALLEVLRPLVDFPLVLPVADSIRSRGGRTSFHAKVLMGSHAQFATRPFEVSGLLETDVQVLDPDGARVSLWPWLNWHRCGPCGHEALWGFDRLGERRRELQFSEWGKDHKDTVPSDDIPPAFWLALGEPEA